MKAMVGGYDFGESKFNRATQADAADGKFVQGICVCQALQQGASPFDTVVDEPVHSAAAARTIRRTITTEIRGAHHAAPRAWPIRATCLRCG